MGIGRNKTGDAISGLSYIDVKREWRCKMIYFIESNGDNFDVEVAMRYVNDHVNLGYSENMGIEGFDLRQKKSVLLEMQRVINRSYQISADQPMLAQGRLKKLRIFVKKIIWKCIKYWLKGMALTQTTFNGFVVQYINQELDVLEHISSEVARLNMDIINIQNKIEHTSFPCDSYLEFEKTLKDEEPAIKE